MDIELSELFKGTDQCLECANQLPFLVKQNKALSFSGFFLKRAMNDLWVIKKLIRSGFTSQAASIECSLLEQCAYVHLILEDPELEKDIRAKISSTELSNYGNPMELFEQVEKRRGSSPYPLYKWLCKLKHPSLITVSHEARSLGNEEKYFIVVSPNANENDLGNKRYILVTAMIELHGTIRNFSEKGLLDTRQEEGKDWIKKMRDLQDLFLKTLADSNYKLSHSLINTQYAKDNWKKIMGKEYPIK